LALASRARRRLCDISTPKNWNGAIGDALLKLVTGDIDADRGRREEAQDQIGENTSIL